MAAKTANIKELAARLNLSKGTVSRILNDETAPFSAETRKRVLSLAEEIGYRPNTIARALATGRTGAIGFWVRLLGASYHAHVAQSFATEIESHSYQLVVRLYGHDQARGAKNDVSRPVLDSVDGIITHGMPPRSWAALAQASPRRVPMVVTGAIPDPEPLDYVKLDLRSAARAAVEHLLQPGRTRVAFLSTGRFDERHAAYLAVMAEAGLTPRVIETVSETRAETRNAFRDYVDAHGCPEALFCHNDDAAIAAYRACLSLGIRMPDDMALVGCDGIEETDYLPTPISTIVQPIGEMCRLAWRYLERRMQEPEAPPQRAILEPTLVIRESSGGPSL